MTFTYFKQTSPLFKDFPSSLIDNDEMLYLCWETKSSSCTIYFRLGGILYSPLSEKMLRY